VSTISELRATASASYGGATRRRLAGEHAADRGHKFVGLGSGLLRTRSLAQQAVACVVVEQAEGDLVEGGPGGVCLSENVDAVAVLLRLTPLTLSLGPPEGA
jgi:hypothetical protein